LARADSESTGESQTDRDSGSKQIDSGHKPVQASKRMIHLTIDRDPVHPGDDLESHKYSIVVSSNATVAEVVKKIRPLGSWFWGGYLPRMGGAATWIFGTLRLPDAPFSQYWLDRPIAVVSGRWPEPRFLLNPATAIIDYFKPGNFGKLHFNYWWQKDPIEVFERLRAGEPPPPQA
jgi:hypothetical protein